MPVMARRLLHGYRITAHRFSRKVSTMQRTQLHFVADFHVALSTRRAQIAEMTIAPGHAEGGPGNRHVGADQWMFVQAGAGIAHVGGKRLPLRRGTVLLIERGEEHEIRNTGRTALRTLNFYTPPAYANDDELLPRGRSKRISK